MRKVLAVFLPVALVALTVWCSSLAAQETAAAPATRHYTLKRTAFPINVDGKLDEAAWKAAVPVSLEAKNGGQPRQATRAWMLRDDRYLYFAFDCQDSHIWSTLKQRDEPLYNEEVVEVFIAADGNKAGYLELEVNPLGTLWDGFILNKGNRRVALLAWNSLDIKWAVHLNGTLNDPADTDKGWSVELALPLKDIDTAPHMPPQAGDRWRINLYRIDLPEGAGKPGDPSAWSPVSGKTFHDPDRFGEVIFSDEKVQ